MPEIHLVFSDGRTRKIELSDEELRLGRDSDNDVVLDDEGVSRHHAKIERKKNHFFIVDLDSANGTIVNGKKRKKGKLKHEDIVFIGRTKLEFRTEEKPDTVSPEAQETAPEKEEGLEQTQVITSSHADSCEVTTETLLVPSEPLEKTTPSQKTEVAEGVPPSASMEEILLSLKRTNRVLFVLYEISRQMNTLHDFRDLL